MSSSARIASAIIRASARRGTAGRGVPAALAGLLVACVLVVLAWTHAVYQGGERRDAARAPVSTASGPVVGSYLDTYSTPPIAAVLVQPAGDPRRSPPPGLSAWPGRGEAALSPSLVETYPLGTRSPWGRVTQVIAPERLVNWNEQLVYANPADYDIPREAVNEVRGWGGASWLSGDRFAYHPESQMMWLIGVLLLFPALCLSGQIASARVSSLRAPLAVLHGMGAPLSVRAWAAWLAVARPAGLGALGAGMLGCLPLALGRLPLPGIGVVIQGRDVRDSLVWVALAACTAVMILWVQAVVAVRPRRLVATSATLNETPWRSRAVLAWGAPVGLALLLLAPSIAAASSVEAAGAVAAGGLLTFLLCAPFLVSGILAVLARRMATVAEGPRLLLAARMLTASLRMVEVVAVGIVLSLSLFAIVNFFTGYSGDIVAQADAANTRAARRLVVVRTPVSKGWTAAKVARVSRLDESDVLPLVDADDGRSMAGTCEQLRQHRLRCPATTHPVALDALPDVRDFVATTMVVRSDALSVPATSYLVMSPNPLDLATLNAQGFAPQLRFAQIGDEWANPEKTTTHQLRWVKLWTGLGVPLLVAALVLGCRGTLSIRLRRAEVLRAADPRQVSWTISAAVLLVPLLISVAVGCAAYFALGTVLGTLYAGMRPMGPTLAALGGIAVIAAVGTWTVLTRSVAKDRIASSARFS